MYLVNPSGAIVGVSEDRVDELLNDGFRHATPHEIAKITNKAKGHPIHIITHAAEANGYGESRLALERELEAVGVSPLPRFTGQTIGFLYGVPPVMPKLKTPVKVLYTMFESTSIPSDWVEFCRMADRVIVPSKFCQEAFASKGIKSEVIPLGYNHHVYQYIERKPEKREPFTFLHYNAFNVRKGFDILWRAFTEEFRDDDRVKLVLKTVKTKPPFPILESKYPNIEVISEEYNHDQMMKLLERADAFVYPSRGEGFGLTPLEALATGLPTIIPNGSGMSEYFNPDHFIEVKIKGNSKSVYQHFDTKDVGFMIEPDQKDLQRKMRQLFDNQIEEKRRAKAGAKWVRENFSITRTARLLKSRFAHFDRTIADIEVSEKADIAFIMQNIDYYSGGRYHNWIQAHMLNQSRRVTVYTDRLPTFIDDFELYPELDIRVVPDFRKLDVEAELYIGSQVKGAIKAAELAGKYNKNVIFTVFDPPGWMKSSNVVSPDEMKAHDDMIEEASKHNVEPWLLCLTESAVEPFRKYYKTEKVRYHWPAINSKVADIYSKRNHSKPWVVMVSRNNRRKGFKEALAAFQPFKDTHELHIITHGKGSLENLSLQYGYQPKIHVQISDDEKFKIMALSSAMLSASKFEGFGMWAAEASAMGLPLAAYRLPSLYPEVFNDSEKTGVYWADPGDVKSLSKALKQALSVTGKHEPDNRFAIDGEISKQLNSIISEVVSSNVTRPKPAPTNEVKVTAMMIALNEEQFIESSIRALIAKPEIDQIVIVEGADRKYPTATDDGLSVDNTSQIVEKLASECGKIQYMKMGWVDGKEALRQRCIDEVPSDDPDRWCLFVDADEVWSDSEFEKLIDEIKRHPQSGAIYFRHLHFWKKPGTIATGSMWDRPLFRLYRNAENGLKIHSHGNEPHLPNGKRLGDVYGRETNMNIKLHHYGYMKRGDDVRDKIEYYRRRDKGLNVIDTFSNWKQGDSTQPTHGGGTVSEYTGNHPKYISEALAEKKTPKSTPEEKPKKQAKQPLSDSPENPSPTTPPPTTPRGESGNSGKPSGVGEGSDSIDDYEFFSQFGEDRYIYENLTQKREGFFVDVGAGNPKRLSNTYFFERLGWNGLCIDGDQRQVDQLKEIRSVPVVKAVIAGEAKETNFYLADKPELSRIDPPPPKYADRFEKSEKVTTQTLNSVLEKHEVGRIDLLSIDIEGQELEVLKSFNWERYDPDILIVEVVTLENSDLFEKVEDFFSSRPYEVVFETIANIIYKRKESKK